MKKTIKWTLTTIAIMTIFVIGAGRELTTGAIIAAGVALTWLGLCAIATWKDEKRDDH